MQIKFKTSEDILARTMIAKSKMPVDFANYLWDNYRESYKQLKDDLSADVDEKMLEEVKSQPVFKDNLKQSRTNLKRIKHNWNIKKKEINSFLEKVLRLDLSLNTKGYIVAPHLRCGTHLKNTNSFVYGHVNGVDEPNYDLVYLVHESLHSYFNNDDLSHAVIEEIADIELGKVLNKSQVGYETHEYLRELHAKLFPFWNLYLNRTAAEIENEQVNRNIHYDIERFEAYREDLSIKNIDEFVSYVKERLQV